MRLGLRVGVMLFAAVSVSLVSLTVRADDYPSHPIHLIVPFAAGGSSDSLARIIAPELSKRLGQPVVIENRAGAGGTIGTQSVAQSEPNGLTIGVVSPGSIVVAVTLMKKLPYDPLKDLKPVGLIADLPIVLVASSSLAANNVRELISLEKASPGSLSFASAGVGTTMHLSGELLNSMTGMKLLHVAYKGAGPAMNGMLVGEVPLGFLDLPAVAGQVSAGTLKILGVTGKRRTATAPEIPTLAETGVPGYDMSGWFGIVVPARTPDAIVVRLNAEFANVMSMPAVQDRLLKIGIQPMISSSKEFGDFIKAEIPKMADVIKSSGISAE